MKGSVRIYVVDDDPSARKGLTRLLRTAGHDVRDFASANEFLGALDHDVPGCLVLDARMPGMTGEELHAELLARDIQLPIIVITACDDIATREQAQKMGAVSFLRKPVDGTALLDTIEWALRPDHSH
jgi:two-component system response regulator FixJ